MEADYLLSFGAWAEPAPWGAAMSAMLEVLAGKSLVCGESNATPTPLGRLVAAALRDGQTRRARREAAEAEERGRAGVCPAQREIRTTRESLAHALTRYSVRERSRQGRAR